jgi:hypothetical protein
VVESYVAKVKWNKHTTVSDVALVTWRIAQCADPFPLQQRWPPGEQVMPAPGIQIEV